VLKRTDQEATGSEVVWAKELGYELDDDRIHQLLTPAGRLAIQTAGQIQLERGLRARNAGADDARSVVLVGAEGRREGKRPRRIEPKPTSTGPEAALQQRKPRDW
jgi:hypothetical protein